MWHLWLRERVTMAEVDGPVYPPVGRSIDDVMDMVDTLGEWSAAEQRLWDRQKHQED